MRRILCPIFQLYMRKKWAYLFGPIFASLGCVVGETHLEIHAGNSNHHHHNFRKPSSSFHTRGGFQATLRKMISCYFTNWSPSTYCSLANSKNETQWVVLRLKIHLFSHCSSLKRCEFARIFNVRFEFSVKYGRFLAHIFVSNIPPCTTVDALTNILKMGGESFMAHFCIEHPRDEPEED